MMLRKSIQWEERVQCCVWSKSRHDQHVGAILISDPTHVQQRQSNRRRVRYQERQYTDINMPLSSVTTIAEGETDHTKGSFSKS